MNNFARQPVDLSTYSAAPRYNIKAVVQATGILPSTLRAWERRYQMTQPQRSPSGYRLYSERDVAIIRWLKSQVDAGLVISQAVTWLDIQRAQGNDLLPAALTPEEIASIDGAQASEATPRADATTSDESHALQSPKVTQPLPAHHTAQPGQPAQSLHSPNGATSYAALQAALLRALVDYDEAGAERVLSDAFALYPIEDIGEELIRPVLIEIGERWHRHELSIVKEHFASNFLLQRLTSLLRAVRVPAAASHSAQNGTQNGAHNGARHSPPVIWVGCAASELHEGGALLLAIYLRRAGYQVHYLGQDVPLHDLVAEARQEQPGLILLSASTSKGAASLADMARALAEGAPDAQVGFGGGIFASQPALQQSIPGIWLGETGPEAVARVAALLNGS